MKNNIHNLTANNLNQNTPLWRYMDFTKFADLILKNQIYLCRLDAYEDVYEGYLSEIDRANIHKSYASISKIMSSPASVAVRDENIRSKLILYSYASCWHINEYESAAMWKLYAQTSEAIAIKTSLRRLESALQCAKKSNENDSIYINNIIYLDYDNISTYPENRKNNWLLPMFTKRFSFKHENELRILYMKAEGMAAMGNTCTGKIIEGKDTDDLKKENILGFNIDVDINELIEAIYISPNAPSWFRDMTEKFLLKMGLNNIKCIKSDLYDLK